jgi:hypothetical protein
MLNGEESNERWWMMGKELSVINVESVYLLSGEGSGECW